MDSASLRGLVMLGVAEAAGVEDIRAHPQFLGGFPGDGHLIARDHLDVYAHLAGGRDGRLGVVAGRVEQRQHAEKLPGALPVRPGHAQRAEAARRKLVDRLLDGGLHLPGVGRQLQDHLRRALGHLELVPSAPLTVASVRLCTGSKGWKWTTW